jgi:hypothetical protein
MQHWLLRTVTLPVVEVRFEVLPTMNMKILVWDMMTVILYTGVNVWEESSGTSLLIVSAKFFGLRNVGVGAFK